MLKENVLEMLENEYSKGFVISYMREDNTIGIEEFNPIYYKVFDDVYAITSLFLKITIEE